MNEQDSIQQLKAGNATAFAHIYEQHRTHVFAYAMHLLKNHEMAEDITQEVFMKLWNDRASLRPDTEHLGPLLSVMTKHRCFDEFRKTERLTAGSKHYAYHKQYAQATIPVEDKEMGHIIATAVAQLSPVDRKAFTLSYLEDKSNREVAQALGIEYGSAKNRVSKARQAAKAIILTIVGKGNDLLR
ncbi:RNA polymerase sigma-70 factor, ECF subfamily [Chitinophaga costaii]|uniref:RNA polymerase sigma-70 factor, ECF subfamily n=1 Tax=Chitinophaga costaii TaxID=1335309 RepID=A0A1C3YR01_9BACT|nr:sigma-70 family RNA polymerase sigma factor [Chitinophaga costaii]PUZ30063.1 hypothetical protein DCM91_00860 [Chitinophaga costaii]SCB72490.1 RNA polymerase sigma-70 factor, ECF subfamily [Chitinophaga costaii]